MFGFSYQDNELFCEDVAVTKLATEFGTPLYVYSQNAIRENFVAINSAFNAHAPTLTAYSVKSCSNVNILKLLAECGAGFDIVSGGELFRVLKAGGDPQKIVFAGVAKTTAEIKFALENNILLFNCESEAEIYRINEIAATMNKIAAVSLRINPDIDAKTHAKTTTAKKENKFGIEFARAEKLIHEITQLKNIVVRGVDVHLGSPINALAPYQHGVEKLLAFLKNAPSFIEFIDVGGGFGLLYNDENTPTFAEYAATIVKPLAKTGKKIIIEPGRSLIGNTAILLAEIQYVKTNSAKTFYLTDTGMNDLIRPAMYDSFHFIWAVKNKSLPACKLFPENPPLSANEIAQLKAVDVTGPICESSDVFAAERFLPPMKQGEKLAIFSAGAYGFSMSSNYNSRPRAAEILVDGASYRVIRERETWDDLVRGEN